ncbi:MAG: DUF4388 domain-containing protein [bacterium]|nr:DUF4388 domain-containing protein [bacterium]
MKGRADMGVMKSRMGTLGAGGVIRIVEPLCREGWSGALRLRHARRTGSIWMVGGEIVHALWIEGGRKAEGRRAFERLMTWSEGTYLLDDEALPPERSVREDMATLLRDKLSEAAAERGEAITQAPAERPMDLEALLTHLRDRVPGIESVSVSSGDDLAASTEHDATRREWLHRQWQAFRDETDDQTETLLLRQGNRTVLVVRHGSLAAILSAQPQTTPEALLWAGAEAGRQIKFLDYRENMAKSV